MKILKNIIKLFILFVIGGITYYIIEIFWRGHSDYSMIIVGGICFILIGGLNNYLPWNLSLLTQMILGSVLVTLVEFISGCILNLWLKLNIWDYSDMPFNILGQICLPFSLLWILLSLIAILIDDILRHVLFGDEKPHYHWIKNSKEFYIGDNYEY